MGDRRHAAASADGTRIVGRVRGTGPALVFVHGGLGDGEHSFRELVGLLADRFTCVTMSTRGRGLSAAPASGDYSPPRLVEDVVAVVDSLGEPAGVVGYSSGGMFALSAAADCRQLSALAVYEPPVRAATEADAERFAAMGARTVEAGTAGRLEEAARHAIELVVRDDELAALEAAGTFEAWAKNVPTGIQELGHYASGGGPDPLAPDRLARITVPVLYLLGARTRDWYREGARHLAEHVPDLRVTEIDGVGHFAPLLAPEALAGHLADFFAATLEPA